MPFLGAQRWLLPRAPTLLALLLVLLMSVSLALQSVALRRLLLSPAASSSAAPESRSHSTNMQSLLGLFDSGVTTTRSAPSTTMRLTLLGSFVHADSQRSSAIIRKDDGKPQRFRVGDNVQDGIRLHAVYPDRIELERQGHLETLSFPRRASTANKLISNFGNVESGATQDSPSASAEQLEMLQDDEFIQLRERMAKLREQMGSAEPSTTPSEPTSAETP